MTNVTRALLWAAAIIAVALCAAFEIIGDETATTLLIVLPVVAVTTMRANRRCSLGRAA